MFTATMQRQSGTYQTKTKQMQSAEHVERFIEQAKRLAVTVKYDDKFDGMDHGLVRAVRLSSKTSDYVLTIHKFT